MNRRLFCDEYFSRSREEVIVEITMPCVSSVVGLDFEGLGLDQVRVKEVHEDGPFHNTRLRAGQTVRSINQKRPASAAHALELILSTDPGTPLTLTVEESEITECSYIYETILPWKSESPPIHFASSRGGALVRISHVLDSSDSNNSSADSRQVKVGDIVLAVNGVVVSHAMTAFQLMLQSGAQAPEMQQQAQEETVTLKCAKLDALFLELVRLYPQITHHVDGNFKFEPCTPSTSYGVSYKLQAPFRHFRGPVVANLDVNLDSLHLEDRHENMHLVVQPNDTPTMDLFGDAIVVFQGRYADGIQPFIRKFNTFLERELRHLESLVIRHAWVTNVRVAIPVRPRPVTPRMSTAMDGEHTDQSIPTKMDSE